MAALRVLFILALPITGNAGYVLAYVLLTAWALRGPMEAIEALCLSVIIGLANQGLFPPPDAVALLRWPVLFAAFGTAVITKRPRPWKWPPVLKTAAALAGVIAIETLIASYAKDVSMSKVVVFLVGLVAIVLNMQIAKEKHPEQLNRWMLTFPSVFVIASFPLIVTSFGFVATNHGFQGLFNQPQAYGVFLAPFTAWLIVRVYTGHSSHWFWWCVAAIAIVSLVATQARTGIFAAMIGMLFAAAIGRISNERHAFRTIIMALFIFSGGLLLYGYAYDAIMPKIEAVAFKLNNADSFSGALIQSRGVLAERSMPNFYDNPIFGIGFGLPSRPWDLDVTRFMGIPIGSPAEKGVIVISVLEELGLVGMLGFLALIFVIVYRPLLWRSAGPVAITIAALATNAGEATLFSPGGIGMIVWIWIAYGTCAPLQIVMERKQHRMHLNGPRYRTA